MIKVPRFAAPATAGHWLSPTRRLAAGDIDRPSQGDTLCLGKQSREEAADMVEEAGGAVREPAGQRLGKIVSVDFHVTSACTQDCAYCWGSLGFRRPVATSHALRIIDRLPRHGIRRVVFTGGDPLLRGDIGQLIRHASELGLEVAVSTTGDQLTEGFLATYGRYMDLVSVPLDGSCEAVSGQTKRPGHFSAVMAALTLLGRYPRIDVKVGTAVTRKNLHDVPGMARLVDEWAKGVENRVFYNFFQTFPRAMRPVDWEAFLVKDDEFAAVCEAVAADTSLRVNFLSTDTLDRLYALIFPDGGLYVPSGDRYHYLGPFLEIDDLDAAIERSEFDWAKHEIHSRGWSRSKVG